MPKPKNEIIYNFFKDANGNPAGGSATGKGIKISFQNGPLEGVRSPNGAFVEDLIEIAINRLFFFQDSRFVDEYNAKAILHLQEAGAALAERFKHRQKLGIEGFHLTAKDVKDSPRKPQDPDSEEDAQDKEDAVKMVAQQMADIVAAAKTEKVKPADYAFLKDHITEPMSEEVRDVALILIDELKDSMGMSKIKDNVKEAILSAAETIQKKGIVSVFAGKTTKKKTAKKK